MKTYINDNGSVTVVRVYWASITGERTGERTFMGNEQTVTRAKNYETKLLNLGFYTHLEEAAQ